MLKLTDAAIAKAAKIAQESGKATELGDAGCQGLRLRMAASGRKTWKWVGRDSSGAVRRHLLGDYPTMSISAARERARALRQDVKFNGADPTKEARQKRQVGAYARAGIGTLGAFVDRYEERGVLALTPDHLLSKEKRAEKRADEAARPSWAAGAKRVRRVFHSLLKKHVSELTRDDMIGAMREVNVLGAALKRDARFAARTLRPWLRQNHETRHLGDISTGGRKSRARILSTDEIAAILVVLDASDQPHERAMRFIFWTMTRLEEATAATWDEFNLNTGRWTMKRKTKNEEPLVLDLPPQAVAFLNVIKPKKTLPGQLLFTTRKGTKLGNWDRARKRIHVASKTDGWHCHDIRRSAATIMGNLGVLPAIVEAALNHVIIYSEIASAYNKATYRPEVKVALSKLADHYDSLKPPPMDDNS